MAEENTQARRPTQRRRTASRSPVWMHFARIEENNGQVNARCNRCHRVLSANTRSGTSSLLRHTVACSRQEGGGAAAEAARPRLALPRAPSSRSLAASSSGPQPGLVDEASGELARMIVYHGYDPSFVEDDYFRSFVQSLNPRFRVPSREAIEEMCDGIFYGPWFYMILRLICLKGRVSLVVGKATTSEGDVLYTACHFIDGEFIFVKVILNAYLVAPPGGYRGPILGVHEVSLEDAVDRIMFDISEHEHDILRRLFMMPQTLTDDGIHLTIKNCIEQKLSSGTSPTSTKLICTAYMDQVLHSVARCLLPSKKFREDMFFNKEDLYMMRQDRQELLSQLGLDDPLEYHECWYSYYCSLQVLHSLPSTSAGRDRELTGLLCKIWGQIFHSIKRVSTSSSPTSNLCLIQLLNVRAVLRSELVREPDFFCDGKNVADVLREALDTLDKAIQDSYLVWSIPLVLDPRYKFEGLTLMFEKDIGCEAAGRYISEVRRKIEELYTDYHSGTVGTNGANNSDGANGMAILSSANRMEQDWHEHYRLNHATTTTTGTELIRYLEDHLVPPTTVGFDILNWWKVNSSWYPTVARVARDALAMPTCSKLSSEQLGQVRSIVRGYSEERLYTSSFRGSQNQPFVTSSTSEDAHERTI